MEPGQSYHIYNHANGTENIFQEEENYLYFLKQYTKYLGAWVDTYAYCLMPNHFHLLVGVRPEVNLSGFQNLTGLEMIKHPANNPTIKAFSDFFNSYTKAFNKRYERKGNLFIRAFNRIPIVSESQWQETFLYIHLNPVKHGFVERTEDWKWSSWHGYQQLDKHSSLERSYYLNFFDGIGHVQEMMETKKEWLLNKEYE